ncbi:TonB-dependent receptor [Sphingosinicella terrae]|uniref:TonB-dependent receptor n=1 Tax=Sphingosinicella terrae TaxID=2172047 RepID=UPI0013B3B5BB|nr:TonB-dependent receptor [Sphingosinicella terrae]
MRKLIWAASLATLAIATGAQAQDAPADEAQALETADAEGAGDQIEDIVVTASRRAESVQDSSLSIAVLGGETLANAGVTQASDLGTVVPGLTVSLGGGTNQTYLRGVGSFATDASAESAIAYNINGVYISRPNGIGPIFFDLERVEVLKGPQGTLYGRNATGGAINLVTRRPTAGITGDFSVDIGNYDLIRVTGAVGGGSDTFAVRAAVQYTDRDGYLTDGYDDQHSLAGRLTALWRPADNVDLLVTGEYVSVDSQGAATVKRSTLSPVPDDPWEGPSVGNAQQPPTAFIPGGTRIRDDGFNLIDVWALSAELNVDLGGATLTFIPAYRDTRASYLTYTPGFYFDTAETSQQQSYELRLGNDGDRLKWVAGVYYFDEDQTQLYELQALPIQRSIVNTTLDTRSWAAFGEATYSLTDTFRVIGGLRYSEDRKRQGGFTNAFLPTVATISNEGRRSFDDISWRAGLEYDVGPENMLFATAARGYKSGGFFPSVPQPNNSFEPETLTAFTVGSRNRFLGNTLQINLEGFYWKYRDKQERFLGATPSGTTGLLTTNAGRATLYGASLDLQWRPTPQGTFRAAVEYLHTNYDSFVYDVYSPPIAPPFPGFVNSYPTEATGCTLGPVRPYAGNDNPPLPPGVPVPPALLTDSQQSVDCSGMPLVRAPKWTGSAGYQHRFDLDGDHRIVAGADLQFASGQYLSPDFIESGRDDGYVSLNADLSFESTDGYTITLWGRNLTDEAIYTGGGRYAFSRGVAAGGDPTLFYANIRAPRTYGVTFRAGF